MMDDQRMSETEDQMDSDMLDDMDATSDADAILGGRRTAGDPCDGGE